VGDRSDVLAAYAEDVVALEEALHAVTAERDAYRTMTSLALTRVAELTAEQTRLRQRLWDLTRRERSRSSRRPR
jgi:hypothetical protein